MSIHPTARCCFGNYDKTRPDHSDGQSGQIAEQNIASQLATQTDNRVRNNWLFYYCETAHYSNARNYWLPLKWYKLRLELDRKRREKSHPWQGGID